MLLYVLGIVAFLLTCRTFAKSASAKTTLTAIEAPKDDRDEKLSKFFGQFQQTEE